MTRRGAREQAFLLLFEMIFNPKTSQELSEEAAEYQEKAANPFSLQVGKIVEEHQEEIDSIIQKFSPKWKINRLPKVTLAILRLAVCEIYWIDDIPIGASINEAVELAKKYGGDDDPAYVNGVLGSIVRAKDGQL